MVIYPQIDLDQISKLSEKRLTPEYMVGRWPEDSTAALPWSRSSIVVALPLPLADVIASFPMARSMSLAPG